MNNCIFCKIINGDFNTEFVYEDEKLVAFNDINPQAPTHILFVPKAHVESLNELNDTTIVMDIFEAIKKVAKAKGITVSCDLNYRGNLWDSETARSVMTGLMPYVDVCLANEEDAEKVLGIHTEANNIAAGVLNYEGYADTARKICDTYGCRYTSFTLRESYSASRNGWSGMLYNAANGKAYFSKKYDIQIVDRVGGGDSFTAALLYGLMKKKSDQEIIDFAAAASCLKHTIEGDFNRVTVSEVQHLLESGGNGRIAR